MKNNELQIPTFIPTLPKAAQGYHWVYRGEAWKADNVYGMFYDNVTREFSYITDHFDPTYIFVGLNGNYYFEGVEDEELVLPPPESIPFIKFTIMTWDDWQCQVIQNIEQQLKDGDLEVTDILDLPRFEVDDIYDFCQATKFYDVCPSQVFVEHYLNENIYWWIDGDNTCKIENPNIS